MTSAWLKEEGVPLPSNQAMTFHSMVDVGNYTQLFEIRQGSDPLMINYQHIPAHMEGSH